MLGKVPLVLQLGQCSSLITSQPIIWPLLAYRRLVDGDDLASFLLSSLFLAVQPPCHIGVVQLRLVHGNFCFSGFYLRLLGTTAESDVCFKCVYVVLENAEFRK